MRLRMLRKKTLKSLFYPQKQQQQKINCLEIFGFEIFRIQFLGDNSFTTNRSAYKCQVLQKTN